MKAKRKVREREEKFRELTAKNAENAR